MAQRISRRSLFLIALMALVLLSVVILLHLSKTRELHGLLVDLEYGEPHPQRHAELSDGVTQHLRKEISSARNLHVVLDYIHFTEFTKDAVSSLDPDFLILSPQSTPWHAYREEAGSLEVAEETLRALVLDKNMPVLGICGGHQFMALAFGGTVDFIDPGFAGIPQDRYPKIGLAEKGVVELQTLRDDPILEGVAAHPGTFRVIESHHEEIKLIPPTFTNIARSKLSEIQLMRIPGKIVYGTAFHPERPKVHGMNDSKLLDGRRILANFLTMVPVRGQSPRTPRVR